MSERKKLLDNIVKFPLERVSLSSAADVSKRRGGGRIDDITSYRLMKEENARRDQNLETLFGDNPLLDLQAYRQNRDVAIPTRFIFAASTLVSDLDRGLAFLSAGHGLELKDA